MVPRVKTYVEGYDENLGGGIPEGHTVLVAGAPGTMKTSLAFSILFRNAVEGSKRSLFISLEQNKECLEDQMNSLGMKRESAKEKMAVLDLASMRIRIGNLCGEALMNLVKMYVENIKKSFDYDLLTIDSVDSLKAIAEFQDFKVEYFKLFKWLRDLKVTSFLISELPYPGSGEPSHFDQIMADKKNFLADGIFHLTMDQINSIETQRRIRCVKMRGTKHDTGYFVLRFDSGKFLATKSVA